MLVSAALRYFISIIEPPRVVTRDTTGEGSINCSRPSSHKSQPVDNLNHCPACDLAGQGSLLGRPAVRPAGDPSGHCTPCVWSNRDGRGHLGRGEVGSGRVRSGQVGSLPQVGVVWPAVGSRRWAGAADGRSSVPWLEQPVQRHRSQQGSTHERGGTGTAEARLQRPASESRPPGS